MLGHLLLEDLLQDCLNAFPDPGLYIAFHVMLELVLRGQAPPSSLNPQLTRRYRSFSTGSTVFDTPRKDRLPGSGPRGAPIHHSVAFKLPGNLPGSSPLRP